MALSAACVVALAGPLAGTPAAAETILGAPRVIDGDTLQIGSERIRLFGIDAPESAQKCKDGKGKEYACGEESKLALQRKVGTSQVVCDVKNKDQYGRNVGVCYAGAQGKEDLNAWMVAEGEAVPYTEYSKSYLSQGQQAEAAKKGIWSGEFQRPSDWRKDNPRGGSGDRPQVATLPTSEAPDKRCPIKGNINSSGEKIYHVPGGRYYDATVIDVASGEKWFCSPGEAEKAGWRASRA